MSTRISLRLRSLTTQAHALREVIGRDQELHRLVRILLKSTHHHVAIVGDPGVGKSSLISMLALAVAEGAIPGLPTKVYVLDTAPIMSLFVAGDNPRSCFEALSANLARLSEAIIVIEDIQLLAGDDPARLELTLELLQTITLHRGIHLVVTSTSTSFQRIFRDDYTFGRTFAALELAELHAETIADIMRSAMAAQGISLSPESIELAVQLGGRYGHGRALPDAALRLLEDVAAKLAFDGRQELLPADIREVVAEREGIPLASLETKGQTQLHNLEQRLNTAVIGQDAALRTIARTITKAQLGLGDTTRPRGSFLLLGPSGVGKTETAKALASHVYANPKALVRLDMSEYSEAHSAVRLTGSPPGYVGYEEGGQLTGAVMRQPYSLILLDEIEKAHSKLFDVFLQLLDDGRLTDSSGKTADFTESMLLATSNIGSQEIATAASKGIDVTSPTFLQSTLTPLLLTQFRPEFINRFDAILIYQPLSEATLVTLAQRELTKLDERLSSLGVSFDVPDDLLARLIHEGYNPLFGARPVKRLIATHFEMPLAERIMSGQLPSPVVITGTESWLR